ncbi:glycine receptor subunit alpha-4 isoform X1 [Drosophila nasuta]|uniref:glycine receptor subunit alpha-4 isoform X1 n=1 Tax=Drosophila nasuta TaxID=42062 RepID=UPI00295EBFD2|nr:glycine receptor subunit alpha-4 isoform X1 [Drosophila nasuta]
MQMPNSFRQLKKHNFMVAVVIYLLILEKSIQPCDCVHGFRNNTESAELVSHYESSLSLPDILPIPSKTYDKNRAPKLLGQPTVVYFHVTVLSLDSINEESMTYVTDIFLAQSWRDPRLRLPENMSEQYRILDVDWLHSIWRPDCFFKNAKKVTFHEMSIPNHYLWLYHDKTLLYMSKLTLVLSCAMKFESYPHDTQICSMMIESRKWKIFWATAVFLTGSFYIVSHTVEDLVFIWNMTDPLVVNAEIELPQLDISNNYTTDCTIEYSTGNFTCLAIVFNLRRRLGYHLFHTYIPSALIVVMSWISFWIKPEAIPARVTLGVTSLLTLATQNTQSQQSLPPVSYVKAIDVWMSSCSVFVFLSLMEFAVVNNYMGPVATKAMKGYSDENITDLDDLKVSLSRALLLMIETLQRVLQHHHRESIIEPQYDTFCHGHATAIYIDKFSRFFFPFSFFILNIVYWTTFL